MTCWSRTGSTLIARINSSWHRLAPHPVPLPVATGTGNAVAAPLPRPAWGERVGVRGRWRRSRALRGDAQVFVLMEDVVERVFVVLLDLVDADHPVGDVAVLVKADLALQRLDL